MKILLGSLSALLIAINSCHRDPLVINAEIHKNEIYADAPRNKMDVYIPQYHDSNTATVVLIHGGAWIAGDKNNWDSEFINGLISEGYTVASMNYRYANGDFHNQMDDVYQALKHINQKSTEWGIDSCKFALIGGSAGGHLSLLYAHAFDTIGQVKTAISLAGPTDLTDTVFHRYATNYLIGFVFPLFLGTTFDANPQIYKDASPVFNYSNVPSLFIHGSNDNLVPAQQGIRMFDTLTTHAIPSDTLYFENAGHDVFGSRGANKQKASETIALWLKRYLY